MKVEIVRHNDGTDHAQSLLHGSVSAVLAPRDHGTFEYVQLVGLSVDILQEMINKEAGMMESKERGRDSE